MATNSAFYKKINSELNDKNATLVAVSKTKPAEDIKELYDLGQKDFGENYVQELTEKYDRLPKDIRWHFIGHLQTNKVKYITPFVSLIQSVDSFKLLKEINKEAEKNKRVIHCLLQMHIAKEETKFGLDDKELDEIIGNINQKENDLKNIFIDGLMGMASFTDQTETVKKEFQNLKNLFDKYSSIETENCHLKILSMGMSTDYKMAIEEGSSMVRIGSLLFGKRNA
ncbi:MAG: YggS family pyridoxal phosphate-dependent enzyme [Ginsengibacter sp.]